MNEHKPVENYKRDMPALTRKLIETAERMKKKEARKTAMSWLWATDTARAVLYAQVPGLGEKKGYGYGKAIWDWYMKRIEGMYDPIHDYFMQFGDPEPKNFEPIIQSIKAVEDRLSDGDARSAALTAGTSLGSNWDGTFSTNLQVSFLAPVATAVLPNQKIVAQSLRESIEADRAIYETCQANLSVVAKQAIDALEACGETSGSGTKTGLAILSAITAIGSLALTPFTGGSSVALGASMTLGAINASSNLSSNFVPKDQSLPLGSETVDGVISNLYGVFSKAWQDIDTKEDDIVKVLTGNLKKVTDVRRHANAQGKTGVASPFTPLRPSIIGAPNPTTGLIPKK